MEILLEHFGKIKKSIIKLDGLSLIAGQNDTGKSTVGKCLFALIKSIYNYEQLFFNITEQVMNSNFVEIITPFLREYNIDENLKKQLTELKYNIASNKNDIEYNELLHIVSKIKDIVSNQESKERNNILLNIEKIENLNKNKNTYSATQKVESILNNNIFYGTFFGNFNNSVHTNDVARIVYRQNEKDIIIDLSVENNNFKINNFNVSNLGMSSSDVTFIETPLYLEELKTSNSSYADDLLNKKNVIKKQFNEIYNAEILKEFDVIFKNSKFVYSNRLIKYKVDSNSNELMIHNIASGSKSFGLIYLLLKAGVITKDSLLVLDEPENHLHPAWQIKYAEILCKMVANGYYVLITSHSPYFIQALKVYATKYGIIDNKTDFYFAEKIDEQNYSSIINVKDENGNIDTEKIFESLYQPFEILRKTEI